MLAWVLLPGYVFAAPNDELHAAIESGNAAGVRKALTAKANPNAKDEDGVTALMAAARRGSVEIVTLLLESKADVNAREAEDGGTALIYASWKGHTEVVQLLIKAKARVDFKDKEGNTALDYAVKKNFPEIVRLLKSANASP